jgi:DNA-binding response OmpR family regulator
MARVVLSGLDNKAGSQLAGLLAIDGHRIRREFYRISVNDYLGADIVFVGGLPRDYLPLLRRLRGVDPFLPVVVIASVPHTSEWLDALDAGATDYCVPPFDMKHVRSLMAPGAASLAASA